jgi:predicted MFS family arabinose efflux permease
MAIGFIAITVLLKDAPKPRRRTSLAEPLKALGHRGLRTIVLTALFYNFGFFTLLAFAPLLAGRGAVRHVDADEAAADAPIARQVDAPAPVDVRVVA